MSDMQVHISPLKVIDLQKLLDQDVQESAKLLAAAKEEGFFHLDFRQVDGCADMLRTVEEMYKFQNELFDLPQEQKLKYDIDNLSQMKLNGYERFYDLLCIRLMWIDISQREGILEVS